MTISKADVIKALSTVDDPDLKRDLVSLNMITDLEVTEGKVSFTVVLTTPACPLKEKIRRDCQEAVEAVLKKGDKYDVIFMDHTMPVMVSVVVNWRDTSC